MVNKILRTDIPDGWNIKKLEPDVGFVRSGKRLPKGYYVTSIPTQHPYIRVADMRPGYVDVDGLMYVPDEAYFRIQKYKIYREDIYISVAGTLGIVGQIPDYLDGANLTENANRITDIKCNIKFLMYWLMSSKIQGLINQTQTLGAQPKLALTRIRNFPIILPPIEEQAQIAEVLCNVDTLITNLRKLIRKKKDIRRGSLQFYLNDTKRYEWVECPITELLKPGGIKIGPFGSQLKKEMLLSDGLYKVYGQENVYENDFSIGGRFLTPENFQRLNSCEIIPGDFLMSTMGTIGKCTIVPEHIQKGIMDSHLIRLRFDEKKIEQRYVLYLFSDQFDYLKRQTQQLSVGGIMEGLSVGIVSKLIVRYPKKAKDQKEIIKIFNDMNLEINKLEEKLSKYQKIKQGMMEELLTGKVRLV